MKVYSAIQTGADCQQYSVRCLLTPEELAGLQAAGIIREAEEVVGMQDVADGFVALLERGLSGEAVQ